jgi:hypothetical protein
MQVTNRTLRVSSQRGRYFEHVSCGPLMRAVFLMHLKNIMKIDDIKDKFG